MVEPHTLYPSIEQPILRIDWESVQSYESPSYTVRWKKEHDAQWQVHKSYEKHYVFKERGLSFTDIYEIQVAANTKEENVHSKFSQSCRFQLSDFYGELNIKTMNYEMEK